MILWFGEIFGVKSDGTTPFSSSVYISLFESKIKDYYLGQLTFVIRAFPNYQRA